MSQFDTQESLDLAVSKVKQMSNESLTDYMVNSFYYFRDGERIFAPSRAKDFENYVMARNELMNRLQHETEAS